MCLDVEEPTVKLAEAKTECERWFAYLQRSKDKAIAMQEIAGARRRGEIDEQEGRRRVRALDNGVTVFDGANLEKAVRLLLKHVP
jgi:hypothetical protein